ncbi:hypothetical protein TNCV_2183051 [Trichonephila clavipes]|uniref:Uncharacterized protein n=1 Tax=Trichonephila clavipes TaxID=2585209 RepID=A0A8X7B9G7_TRICX|nr:hypothetical protein TNCV_2183051 [Trichonephila clavipes]
MEVSALKTQRKELRTAFSLSLKKIGTKLMKENINMNLLSILKTQIMDKFQRLDTCQNLVFEQLLELEDAVQEYLDGMEDAQNVNSLLHDSLFLIAGLTSTQCLVLV